MPNHQRSYRTTFNLRDIQNTKDITKKHGNITIKNKHHYSDQIHLILFIQMKLQNIAG